MPELESRRLALYNGLIDHLGPDLAELLMSFLPQTTEIATRSDVGDLKVDVGDLRLDVEQLKVDVGDLKIDVETLKSDVKRLTADMSEVKKDLRHLTRIVQRQGQTMLAGFVTLFAAILAAGFLG